jgi:hypothetical protein
MRVRIWYASSLKLSANVRRCVLCVYSYDSDFSSAEFAAMGGMDRLDEKRTQWNGARLESILQHGSARNRKLRDPSGIGLLLLLVSQWRQPAWNDAVSWTLEILGQDCCVHTCREHRLERFRKGQMAAVDSRLGGVLSFCCVRNLHVGNGLNCALS